MRTRLVARFAIPIMKREQNRRVLIGNLKFLALYYFINFGFYPFRINKVKVKTMIDLTRYNKLLPL